MSPTRDQTLGEFARSRGLPTWKVRRLFERGLLPPARRLGLYRVIGPDEVAAVDEALVKAGYIRPRPA
jgi:hypothetical protein